MPELGWWAHSSENTLAFRRHNFTLESSSGVRVGCFVLPLYSPFAAQREH